MASSDDEAPLVGRRNRSSRLPVSQGDLGSHAGASSAASDGSDDNAPLVPRPAPKGAAKSRAASSGTPTRARQNSARAKAKPKTPIKGKSKGVSKPKSPKPKAKSKTTRRGTPVKRRKVKAEEDDEKVPLEFEKGDARKHFKLGQTRLCPPQGEGQRAFYESLLQENSASLISIKWLVEHGCLVGTQLKERNEQFKQLKQMGAYKPAAGGIRPEFVKEAEKMVAKSAKASAAAAAKAAAAEK